MPRSKGQITRLKNGVWLMRVQRQRNGERKSVSKRFKTRDEAKEALDGLFAEIAKPVPANHTCKELFDEYLKIIKPSLREQSFELYERIIKNHLRGDFDELFLTELTPFILEKFFAGKQSSLSTEMVVKIHRLFKSTLRKAKLWKWIADNPLDEIKPPKRNRKSKEILTPDELKRFFSACPDHAKAQWTFAALTGCRAQEVFGAKWKDVDFEKKTFDVTQVLVRLKNRRWKLDAPKTECSIRTIPLSDDLLNLLKKHKVEQNKLRLSLGDLWSDYDLIFPTNKGKPQRIANIGDRIKKFATDAQIDKNVTPHLFRHTFISTAIRNGGDIKAVSEIAGHANTAITLDIYTHTNFEDKRNVSDAMSDLIIGEVKPFKIKKKMGENVPNKQKVADFSRRKKAKK